MKKRKTFQDSFAECLAELEAQDGLPEQVSRLHDWLRSRIEQHEVFADEAGSEQDFIFLSLAAIVCERVEKHFDTCIEFGNEEGMASDWNTADAAGANDGGGPA